MCTWNFQLFSNISNNPTLCITLIITPFVNLQMVVYLPLMEVWGRENGRGVFLWLVSNINVSVTASCVMGKCQTDVSMSVLCDPKGSMESPCDEDRPRDNAVSLYLVEISQFSHVGEVKVFNCNVWNNNSVPPKLCNFFVFTIIHVPIYTTFFI